MSSTSPPLPPPNPLIGISLKMYFTLARTTSYISSLPPLAALALTHSIDLLLIPDFLSLPGASALLHTHAPTIHLGAQNCFWADHGAYTGEVSPAVLKSLGCAFVELGHAERRELFGETDEVVRKKAQAVVRNRMVPVVCIGEVAEGSVADAARECRAQMEAVLEVTRDAKEVVFAYEPVWAIGKERPASAEYVVGVVRELRKVCEGRRVRFLYGGSAGPGTFERMREGVDGLFLGRFAHEPERLGEVIREVGEFAIRRRE